MNDEIVSPSNLNGCHIQDHWDSLYTSANDPAVKVELQKTGLDVAYESGSFYDTRVAQELPLERWYREARIRRIGEGPSEVHRMVVARSILGSRRD